MSTKTPRCYTDPSWKYTPSGSTNIRALFARVKKQLKAEAEAAKPAVNVKPIRTAKVAK